MEQPWEEQLCCKDERSRSASARQIMWSLLWLEGVTLDGIIRGEIDWCQSWFILFLISVPPPVSGRKIIHDLLVQKHPVFSGFFYLKTTQLYLKAEVRAVMAAG